MYLKAFIMYPHMRESIILEELAEFSGEVTRTKRATIIFTADAAAIVIGCA